MNNVDAKSEHFSRALIELHSNCFGLLACFLGGWSVVIHFHFVVNLITSVGSNIALTHKIKNEMNGTEQRHDILRTWKVSTFLKEFSSDKHTGLCARGSAFLSIPHKPIQGFKLTH